MYLVRVSTSSLHTYSGWRGLCVGGRNWLGFCVRSEHDWILVWASKLTCFFVGGRNWFDFSVGYRNWLDFGVGIGIDLVFCVGVENHLVLISGSKLTGVFCRGVDIDLIEWGSNWLDWSVGVEINLVFVWEIEIILILAWRSKLTWSLCGASILTWFLCAARKWLVLSEGFDWLGFCAGGWSWLSFSMRSENDLFLVWASKLTCFFVGGRN